MGVGGEIRSFSLTHRKYNQNDSGPQCWRQYILTKNSNNMWHPKSAAYEEYASGSMHVFWPTSSWKAWRVYNTKVDRVYGDTLQGSISDPPSNWIGEILNHWYGYTKHLQDFP